MGPKSSSARTSVDIFLITSLLALLLDKLLKCDDDESSVDPITDNGREINPKEICPVVTK